MLRRNIRLKITQGTKYLFLTLSSSRIIPISAASVRTWTQFQQMSQEDRLVHLQSVHGAKIMTATLSITYSSFLTTFQPRQEHLWFGCFTNEILMVVKGVSPNGRVSYFQVLDNNRLQSYTFGCSYL